MPVRLLNSAVLRWPDRQCVDKAIREWATRLASQREDIVRIGYFGSYASGDPGVGSDVDVVGVVTDSDLPFETRPLRRDTSELPVPVDLLVYTQKEWDSLDPGCRFHRMLKEQTVWVYTQGQRKVEV